VHAQNDTAVCSAVLSLCLTRHRNAQQQHTALRKQPSPLASAFACCFCCFCFGWSSSSCHVRPCYTLLELTTAAQALPTACRPPASRWHVPLCCHVP
jgi:hypothetical protein